MKAYNDVEMPVVAYSPSVAVPANDR